MRDVSRHGLDWRTAVAIRQLHLDVDTLRDAQRVFQFDAQISDGAIDFRMAKQKLHRTKITRFAVDFCGFGSAKRMCAISTGFQTNRRYPISY